MMTAHLDPKEIAKQIRKNWLHEASCPLCGQHDWSIQHDVYELRKYQPDGEVSDGHIVPIIPVVCKKCGNTVLINGCVAGVVEQG